MIKKLFDNDFDIHPNNVRKILDIINKNKNIKDKYTNFINRNDLIKILNDSLEKSLYKHQIKTLYKHQIKTLAYFNDYDKILLFLIFQNNKNYQYLVVKSFSLGLFILLIYKII